MVGCHRDRGSDPLDDFHAALTIDNFNADFITVEGGGRATTRCDCTEWPSNLPVSFYFTRAMPMTGRTIRDSEARPSVLPWKQSSCFVKAVLKVFASRKEVDQAINCFVGVR